MEIKTLKVVDHEDLSGGIESATHFGIHPNYLVNCGSEEDNWWWLSEELPEWCDLGYWTVGYGYELGYYEEGDYGTLQPIAHVPIADAVFKLEIIE